MLCIGIGWLWLASGLAAEAYPVRPIQIIVPFPPGGVADLVARPFATALERELKQPVVIVNKTGAGGAVGMQARGRVQAGRLYPDGGPFEHFGHAGGRCAVRPAVGYKIGRFRADCAAVLRFPTVLVVSSKSPWKTVADFVADAKKRPGEIKYSSSGVYGTMHVAMEMFAHSAGIKLRHIPTGGGGPALTALLGGHVDALSGGPNVSIPQVRAGTVRVLASWGANALTALPDVPTLKELGYKDVEFYIWSGFFAPGGHPAADHQGAARGHGQGRPGAGFQIGHGEDGDADRLSGCSGIPEILGHRRRQAGEGGAQHRKVNR